MTTKITDAATITISKDAAETGCRWRLVGEEVQYRGIDPELDTGWYRVGTGVETFAAQLRAEKAADLPELRTLHAALTTQMIRLEGASLTLETEADRAQAAREHAIAVNRRALVKAKIDRAQ